MLDLPATWRKRISSYLRKEGGMCMNVGSLTLKKGIRRRNLYGPANLVGKAERHLSKWGGVNNIPYSDI